MNADDVTERVDGVRERIRAAGGDPARIQLVAVTKGFGADVVEVALACGLLDIGESYAQELQAKAGTIGAPGAGAVRWHFIGGIQRNKVRRIAHLVHLWHGVDRLSTGEEIARRAPGAAVLVQVNTSGEPQKSGCPPSLAPGVVDGVRDLGLDVRGLMAIGPAGPPEAARPAFRTLVALADRLGLPERSIGMTGDLEVAVQEGATMVRVGNALFGPRLAQRDVGN